MNARDWTERSLELGVGPWGGVALALLFVAAALAVRRLHRLESQAIGRGRRARIAGSWLRLAVIGVALALLARPAIRTIEMESVRPKVALLVDRSASMADGGSLEASRSVESALVPILRDPRDVEVVPFTGDQASAVGDAAAKLGGDAAAALVLVTDARGFRETGSLGVPLFAVPLPTRGVRLALVSPDVPERCLRGDPLPLSVRIIGAGLTGREVELDVRDRSDERTLASRRVTVTSDRFDERVGVTALGLGPGLHALSIVASATVGEALNDRVDVAVDVVDQKLRVLYVEGAPRWTYRFLKSALLRDPAIAARCLLVSADRDFPQEASTGERPLTAFPAWEELQRFDVVLFGDVDAESLNAPSALGDLRRFVEERGGGIAFLCGRNHVPLQLGGTPLEDVLPVTLQAAGAGKSWQSVEPFAFHLTGAGRSSPILRLLADEDRNAAFLEGRSEPVAERPPGFTAFASARGSKPGATVLAEHPTTGAPLLVTQWFGAGRTLFVAIDELWRWRFGAEDLLFYRFFGQAIRFLADVERLAGETAGRAVADRSEYREGESVRVSWRGADPPASLEITGPADTKTSVRLENGEASLVAGAPGLYVVRPGGGGHESAFRIAVPPRERLDEPDVAALRRSAEASGGGIVAPDEVASLASRLPKAAATRRIDRGSRPLVSFAETFWIAVALLAIEWTIRKWLRLA
ncbi:MAG: hypothetical protein HYR85_12445 [Planctomycetes bacterium]|nr:hypothetical protein [Planctomycetota bacterium]MBI3846386.1 hypothetical protein [Planctomycetota bacterium]